MEFFDAAVVVVEFEKNLFGVLAECGRGALDGAWGLFEVEGDAEDA